MIWKAVSVVSVALCVLGDLHHPAISEQTVVQHFSHESRPQEHRGHHGALAHIGPHEPEHHEEYAWSYPSYEFSYKVADPHTGDNKGQHEMRHGDEVRGEYWLIEPDGNKRTVKYHADDKTGFHAEVHNSAPHNHIQLKTKLEQHEPRHEPRVEIRQEVHHPRPEPHHEMHHEPRVEIRQEIHHIRPEHHHELRHEPRVEIRQEIHHPRPEPHHELRHEPRVEIRQEFQHRRPEPHHIPRLELDHHREHKPVVENQQIIHHPIHLPQRPHYVSRKPINVPEHEDLRLRPLGPSRPIEIRPYRPEPTLQHFPPRVHHEEHIQRPILPLYKPQLEREERRYEDFEYGRRIEENRRHHRYHRDDKQQREEAEKNEA